MTKAQKKDAFERAVCEINDNVRFVVELGLGHARLLDEIDSNCRYQATEHEEKLGLTYEGLRRKLAAATRVSEAEYEVAAAHHWAAALGV